MAELSPQIRILTGGEQRLLGSIGHVDPTTIDSYREHGGYGGLERAIAHLGAEGAVGEIAEAKLRGRGGGGTRPPTSGARCAPPPASAGWWWPT